ncbi:MAG: glycosyltransferase 87 family protein [Pyrinomonadaceae bacterium]
MKRLRRASPSLEDAAAAAGSSRLPNLALVVLGCVLFALYVYGRTDNGKNGIAWLIKLIALQAVLYFIAAWLIARARRPARSTLIVVIVFAALFRLGLLFAPPYLSDDIYRYVWDGRVQAAGINPYRYIPANPALASLRDEAIYPKINRREYAHTIYPPVAQMIYFLATRISETVTWMKLVMVAFEALTLLALVRLLASFNWPPERALIYAWHPLVVWEIAGSGHIDAAMIAFVCLALWARRRNLEIATGIALACATLVKFFPILLFPALYRRWGWRMPLAFAATIMVAYLPYLSAGIRGVLGFLPGYTEEEGMQNGVRFYLLTVAHKVLGETNVPNVAFLLFAFCVLAIIALWMFWKREHTERGFVARACLLAATFTLLLSPRYSWYFAWLVPFMCLLAPLSVVPLFYVTAASVVMYGTWLGEQPEWIFTLNTIIYLPCALLGALIFWMYRGWNDDDRGRAQETSPELLEESRPGNYVSSEG